MATELTDIELDEISLVDKGDDPEARIALFKRGETKAVDGKNLPASAFAYAPDKSDPETWTLPLHTFDHVDASADAFAKRNKIPLTERSKVRARIRDAWIREHGQGADLHKALRRGPIEVIRDMLKGEGDAQSFEDVLEENDARRQVMESMDKLWEMVHALQGSVESIMTDDEVTDKRAAVQESLNQFSEALRGAMPSTKGRVTVVGYDPTTRTATLAGDDEMSDEALKQQVEELTKRLDEETVARKAAEEELEKLQAESDDDDVNKDLPEDVRKRIEAQDAEIAKLRDERETEQTKAHLADVAKGVPGLTDTFIKGYRKLDGDERDEMDKVLKGASEAHSQLQKAVGKDGDGTGGTALDRATEEAKKLMADKPTEFGTLAKARAHVWKMNPELKAEYAAERSAAH